VAPFLTVGLLPRAAVLGSIHGNRARLEFFFICVRVVLIR